jgi:hypothetical protein
MQVGPYEYARLAGTGTASGLYAYPCADARRATIRFCRDNGAPFAAEAAQNWSVCA